VTCEREAEALEQIKKIHSKGGTPLTRQETVDFISRHIDMDFPKPARKTRGRKPAQARTQYTSALERRQDIYRRLVKLPILRNGTGHINRADIERRLEECRAQKVPRHKWVSTTCASLAREKKPSEERTVRRIKKAWESR
jgi:hypothetical protein